MSLSKCISDQDGVPTSQNGSPATKAAWIGQKTPKIIPKLARSALSGDPAGVTSATNHHKLIYSGTRWDSYITKWLSGHKSDLNWPKNSQNHPQNIAFSSVRGPDRCYIGNQLLYFQKRSRVKLLGLKRGILCYKVAPRPQKWPELVKKHLYKTISHLARSALSGDPTCVALATNHSLCFY